MDQVTGAGVGGLYVSHKSEKPKQTRFCKYHDKRKHNRDNLMQIKIIVTMCSGNSTTGQTNVSIEHPLLPQGNNRARNNNIGSMPPEFTLCYVFVMIDLEAIGLIICIVLNSKSESRK
jgi:hypothetical protein